MKRVLYPAIVVLTLSVLLTSCSVLNIHSGKGTILYIDLEGGFYGLVGDDGECFEVANLEIDYSEFMVDSLRVRYRVKELKEYISFRMWGTMVEALSLEKLEE